jgi:CRP-like cAMP-binding protein
MPNPEVDFLTKSDLFANQARTVLDAVLSQGTFEKFGPGAIVFKQGEPGDRMYVIKSGVLEVITQPVDNTPAVTVAFLGVGEVVGELAPLGPRVRRSVVPWNSSASTRRSSTTSWARSRDGRSMCEVIAHRLGDVGVASRREQAALRESQFFNLATMIQT